MELLNEVYTNEWRLFHNFYCVLVKLLTKERVGSKLVKKYDEAKTPYQRILESKKTTESGGWPLLSSVERLSGTRQAW